MSDLNMEITGTGPDLVLLHGWGLNLRVWDGLVETLRDRFRMIAVDLPGHGRSSWASGLGTPAEQAWLVHSSLASISMHYSLLGWSLGGQIALDLAAAMPAQVERLVLVASTPRFIESPDWPYGMKEAAINRLAVQLREDYRRTVSDFLELQVRGSLEGQQVLDQLRRALLVHGEAAPEALAIGLNMISTTDLRPTLPHVKAAALVIAGQHDRITPPGASHVLAGALPNAKYVEIRRAAHAPFLSHKAEFAALVSRFLLDGAVERGEMSAAASRSLVTGAAPVAADVPGPTVAGPTTASPVATGPTAVGATSADRAAAGPTAAGPTAADPTSSGSSAASPAAVSPGATSSTPSRTNKRRLKARARKKLRASSVR